MTGAQMSWSTAVLVMTASLLLGASGLMYLSAKAGPGRS